MVWLGLHQVSPKNKHYLSIVGDFISDERQPFPHELNQCRSYITHMPRKHQGTKLHLTNMDTNELLLQFSIIFPLVLMIKEDIDGRMFGKNNIILSVKFGVLQLQFWRDDL